jgi:hypothetical protein
MMGVGAALGAQGMRDAGRDYHSSIVWAAPVVALDDKTHDPSGKARAFVDQKHLDVSLDEEHHVPLL